MKLHPVTTSSSVDLIELSDSIGRSSSVRSRAGKRAKAKGSSFERRIAKSLGDWWETKFYRTPQSGGSYLKEGYELAGDVATPAEDFRFHVECKNQECLGKFHNFLVSEKAAVWKWWEQCQSDCPKDRVPLLIFTKNHMPAWVLLQAELFDILVDKDWSSDGNAGLEHQAYISVGDVIVVTLDRFLAIPKSVMVETLKEYGYVSR